MLKKNVVYFLLFNILAMPSLKAIGGLAFSTPVALSSAGTTIKPMDVAGTSAGFMATWRDSSEHPYATLLSSNGTTWTPPVRIANITNVTSDVEIIASRSGFLATWSNSSDNAYASFSSDNGGTWSSPSLITTNILHSLNPSNISVTSAAFGFVIAWIGTDHNAYASYSSNNGSTWSTAAQIANNGNVGTGSAPCSFVSVSAIDDRCIFTWLGNDGNTYASSSTIGPVSSITNFSGIQKKNDFGVAYELFNTLQWQLSTSSDIAGYYIYRNDVLIATVNPSTTRYQDHNQPINATTIYSVQAFNGAGSISPVKSIRFINGIARPFELT